MKILMNRNFASEDPAARNGGRYESFVIVLVLLRSCTSTILQIESLITNICSERAYMSLMSWFCTKTQRSISTYSKVK